MSRIIGNFEINRKNIIHEELMQKYSNKDKIKDKENLKTNNQEPYENVIIEHFKNNIDIRKNGEKIEKNNYYNDFKPDNNRLYTQKQRIQPTNENIEQVDPNVFFGNSLKNLYI